MKSMIRRPSQALPAGTRKYVSPFGHGVGPIDTDRPPVSELESPKLKMAGNLQFSWLAATTIETKCSIKMRGTRSFDLSCERAMWGGWGGRRKEDKKPETSLYNVNVNMC